MAQIREIANKLLKSKPHELEKRACVLPTVSLKALLENVIDEKRLVLSRYPGVKIILNSQGMPSNEWMAKVDPTDFSAALSNLILKNLSVMAG